MLWPDVMLHVPVQQSALAAQISPPWPHQDEGWHVPDAQRPEQHCAPVLHAFPSVSQDEMDAQVPLLQVWVQHCPLDVHVCPVLVHAG
jgi:hypothetical protein